MGMLNNLLCFAYGVNALKYIATTFKPDLAHKFSSGINISDLSPSQIDQIARIEKIRDEICQKHGLDPKIIKIAAHRGNKAAILNYGDRSFSIISFNEDILSLNSPSKDSINPQFLEEYNRQLSSFGDEPQKIKNAIKKLSYHESLSFGGLHDRCFFVLSDHELHFILKHEILGHTVNRDNLARTAISVSIAFFYLFISSILPSTNTQNIIINISIFLVAVNVFNLFNRVQEKRSNSIGFSEEQSALEGAKRYFKKGYASELVDEKIKSESKKTLIERLKLLQISDYPTFEEEYKRV